MTYSLTAGGKRVRPALVLMTDDLLAGKWQARHSPDILRIATALECVHTYSLIHDDLPAMDDDDLRRGKPTCHVRYGEATAILAGDGLLTFAFELIGRLEKNRATALDLVLTLAGNAGVGGMVGGQELDME
ncbi:MAG: polyprenyl synthetase family protein, partial [Spirochaetia bacterium]|nr:polyprenyl synthetase family protein [Spirochaetia bacterium]